MSSNRIISRFLTAAVCIGVCLAVVAFVPGVKCSKCGRMIEAKNYAAHVKSCPGKPTPTPTPTPTTRQCPKCGKAIAQANYNAHVASHNKPNTTTTRSRDAILQDLMNSMVYVQGGTFMMGALPNDNDAYSGEKPRHQVTVSSFYISKYEVTQELWQAVMGSNPSNFKGNGKLPVEQVSWNNCQEFIRKLNTLTGYAFRLPTEAEWEFAARGGNKSRGYLYSGSNQLDNVAWFNSNSGSKTHPVGQKQPNELGLYDMSGNVWEWCQDWLGSYSSSSQTNPTGPSSASYRVYRGGGWDISARLCRASDRSGDILGIHGDYLGFRLAR